jgi:urease accessory protein
MNSNTRLMTLATMTAAALAPTMAMAHPGHGVGENIVAGLMHPFTGLDHVLMIAAVSAWAAMLKPAGRIVVAACLAVFVAIGAVLPSALTSGAALEAGIALTVVGSGMLLAMGRRWPLWATGTVAALFAMIHGFAHGAEGPADSMAYVPGLAIATGGLALAVSILAARLSAQRIWLRIAGALGVVAGATALISN